MQSLNLTSQRQRCPKIHIHESLRENNGIESITFERCHCRKAIYDKYL